ncbi:hypothetical protein, partial [Sphingobacterium multivorum]|uniref:hypothetical protein n=5 Tax=Sphingobacterium multivorum TaxID=28454 RepID=UPI003DA28977
HCGGNMDDPENWIAPRTSAEPGLDTGSAAETWMDIVLFDLPKLGITMVARSAQCQLKTVRTGAADRGRASHSRWTGTGGYW